MRRAYYNEHDPKAAAWLRELIRCGHIAPGEVDERSIVDVKATDLVGFTQCHFFAGIGVWSYALRCAGWPDDRPVWTGSCPCQPFSVAGKRGGTADERHLWPVFSRLISECRPPVVFGEQVASKDGLAWLDAVHADLEGAGYAFGAADLCAAGVGAPHIRQRLYFVAHAGGERRSEVGTIPRGREEGSREEGMEQRPLYGGSVCGVADDDDERLEGRGERGDGAGERTPRAGGVVGGLGDSERLGPRGDARTSVGEEGRALLRTVGDGIGSPSGIGGVGFAQGVGSGTGFREDRPQFDGAQSPDPSGNGGVAFSDCPRPLAGQRDDPTAGHRDSASPKGVDGRPAPTNGFWRDPDWLFCRDGKWRPVEPKYVWMADGAPGNMGSVRDSCAEQPAEEEEEVDAPAYQAGPGEVLPSVPRTATPEEVQGSSGRLRGVHETPLLRPSVHGDMDGRPDEESQPAKQQKTISEAGGETVRGMREGHDSVSNSPQRPEPDEQRYDEFADFVRLLPSSYTFAQLHGDGLTARVLLYLCEACGAERLVRGAPHEVEEVWQSLSTESKARLQVGFDRGHWVRSVEHPLSRVAEARVMRLRGYGNAICAPVAQAFIEAYLGADRPYGFKEKSQ